MLRLTRFAPFALFVALSSAAAWAQTDATQPTPPKKFKHKQQINSQYDANKDITIVSFTLKQGNAFARMTGGRAPAPAFGEDVRIDLFFAHPGQRLAAPVETAQVWVYYTGEARTRGEYRFRAVLDGREVLLSENVVTAQGGVRDGQKVRSLSTDVTRLQLEQITSAAKAALILPTGEKITLNNEQRNALADFASRMSP